MDKRCEGNSSFSTRIHHSGATVIEIPEEVEDQDVIEMPITPVTEMPITPVTPTSAFDFDSGQETVVPKLKETSRPHVQNVFSNFSEDTTQKDEI